jgi:hypothetical protein
MNILKRFLKSLIIDDVEGEDEVFLNKELERLNINPETNNIRIDSIDKPSIKNLSNDYYSTLEEFYKKHHEEYELLKFIYEFGFTSMKRIDVYLSLKPNIETYLKYMNFVKEFDFLKEYLFVESCILEEYIDTNGCELISKCHFEEDIPNVNIKELIEFSVIAKNELVLYYYDVLYKKIGDDFYEKYQPHEFDEPLKVETLKLIKRKADGRKSVHDDDKDDSDETHYSWFRSKYLKIGEESDNTFVLQAGNAYYVLFKIDSLYVCVSSWTDDSKKSINLSFEKFVTDYKEKQ